MHHQAVGWPLPWPAGMRDQITAALGQLAVPLMESYGDQFTSMPWRRREARMATQ